MKALLNRKLLIVALALVLFILILSIVSMVSGIVSPVNNLFGIILQPIQTFTSNITSSIGNLYGALYEYEKLQAENENLRLLLAERERDAMEFDEAKAENERLKELLGLKEARPYMEFESAHIIERDVSNWSRTFTIDKGTNRGIEKGDCVISAEHYLVGIVSKVGYNWSTVITVIDTDMEIGSKIYRTGLIAVAEGDFSLMQRGLLKMSLLPLEADIQNGDVVLTSGGGGLYPKDIEIGKVEDVEADISGITAKVVLRPSADISMLTQVFVITRYDEDQ